MHIIHTGSASGRMQIQHVINIKTWDNNNPLLESAYFSAPWCQYYSDALNLHYDVKERNKNRNIPQS